MSPNTLTCKKITGLFCEVILPASLCHKLSFMIRKLCHRKANPRRCPPQPELGSSSSAFGGNRPPQGPSRLRVAAQSSPRPSAALAQRRPYLLLLAASSSLIFLMSLLHFSTSTTFSPSTGDQEKQGGYHGYTWRLGRLVTGGSPVAPTSPGVRGGSWLRHWFPVPPTPLILRPPPATRLSHSLFVTFIHTGPRGQKPLPLPASRISTVPAPTSCFFSVPLSAS